MKSSKRSTGSRPSKPSTRGSRPAPRKDDGERSKRPGMRSEPGSQTFSRGAKPSPARGGKPQPSRGGKPAPSRGGKPPFARETKEAPQRGGRPPFARDTKDAPQRSGRPPFARDTKEAPQRGGRPPFAREAKETPMRGGKPPFTRDSKEAPARAQMARDFKTARPVREFHVWGRRPIENYLARLQQAESVDQKAHALHVIADKTGRVPSQLKNIVEPCKAMGFKITLCKSQEDETWPLSSEEQLNHQRVCLKVPQIPTVTIHDVVQNLPEWISETPHGCLGLVLDQVQDPRNFGAILRTAAFFGAKFVVFGEDRQAEITPLVVKASSGGAFSLNLVPTVNINRAIEMLKKCGVWVVGSSLQATARHNQLPADRHYVLVVGNEAKGMRQEVSRHCDYLVKIPGGAAAVDSLNVAVATGVLMSTLQGEEAEKSVHDEEDISGDFEE